MARYRKIDSRIWNDAKFRELSDNGKLVFLMLLTHPSMTSLGAMRATVTFVVYSQKQRLMRAARWWIPTAVITALLLPMVAGDGHFEQRWWWMSPMLLPALVGLGLYRLRGEQAISPQAAAAKSCADAEDAAQRRRELDIARRAESDALQKPWARYTMSAAMVIVALVWGMSDSPPKSPAPLLLLWGAAIFISFDLILLLAIVGGLAWLVIAGLSALPVSAAIIIGALIISSNSRR